MAGFPNLEPVWGLWASRQQLGHSDNTDGVAAQRRWRLGHRWAAWGLQREQRLGGEPQGCVGRKSVVSQGLGRWGGGGGGERITRGTRECLG